MVRYELKPASRRYYIDERYPLPDTIYRAVGHLDAGQWREDYNDALSDLANMMAIATDLTEGEIQRSISIFEAINDL